MPKRKPDVIERYGERLARLCKDAGFTQVGIAAEVGITQRMVAYCEAPDAPRCCWSTAIPCVTGGQREKMRSMNSVSSQKPVKGHRPEILTR